MNSVARNIKKLRQRKGLTQEELADKLHVTRQAVSNWETDKNQPDIETLINLAQVLDTDVNELIYGLAPEPYQRFQRRYVYATILCAAIVITVLLLEIFLYPYIMKVRSRTYNTLPTFIYIFSVRPLGYLAAGAMLPAALSMWADTRVKKSVRIAALVFGLVVVFIAVLMLAQGVITLTIPEAPQPLWFLGYFILIHKGAKIVAYLLLMLAGAGLYLNWNK